MIPFLTLFPRPVQPWATRIAILAIAAVVWIAAQARAGAAPADFTLTAPADGRTFKRSDANGKFVAIHFLLKTECPYCLKHTRDYAKNSAGDSGVVHLFVKPDGADEIKSWAAKARQGQGGGEPGFAVYRDPDATLAAAFGIPGGYRFHGQVVHYPALVLLDPAGKEVFRHVGKSNADRLPYAQFAARLAEARKTAERSK